MSLSWFRSMLIRQAQTLQPNRRGSRKPFRRRKLHLEYLEDRTLLNGNTWYVDALAGPQGDGTSGNPFQTIQQGVNAASAGDTVEVASGTYAENVTVNKSITLLGNEHGVDARTRSGAESIEDGYTNGGKTPFYVTASDVTIDGFTVQGAINGTQFGFGILLAGGTSGAHIVNDIIDNNIVGIGLSNASATDQAVIQYDLIENNNRSGPSTGTGIYTDQYVAGGTVNDVLIDSNTFSGNNTAGIGFSSTDDTKPATGITISNNQFNGNGQGMYALNLTSSSVTGNTFENSFQTGTGWGDIQLLEGTSQVGITNNSMENGGSFALEISNATTGAPAATGVTFSENSVSGYNGGGVAVSIDAPTDYTGTLDASGNWWGTAIGANPSDSTAPTAINALVSNGVTVGSFLNSGTNAATGNGFTPAATTEMWVPVKASTSGLTHVDGVIQSGINTAISGMTVRVAADTYVEDLVIPKSITLAGAGQGSTILLPAVANVGDVNNQGSQISSSTNVILVQSDNVTIHDLTVDGNNPALANTSGSANVGNTNVDARNGIITDFRAGTYHNLVVYNTTVQNIFERGIYSTGATYGNTFNFHNNFVQNVQGNGGSIAIFNFGGSGTIQDNNVNEAGDAISANWSQGTQFLNNTITNSGSGVHTDNNGGAGGVADLIQGNNVSLGMTGAYGIFVFVPYVNVSVQGNTISGVAYGLAAFGGAGGSATFTSNQVTEIATGYGALVTDDQLGYDTGSVSATFSGNTLTGGAVGLYAEQILDNNTPNSTTTVVANSNNLITHNTTAGVQMIGGSVTLTGNTIDSNGIGVQVDGGTLTSATLNTISNSTSDGLQVGSQTSTGIFNETYAQNVATTGITGTVMCNNFVSNGGYGINNQTANLVSAEENFWNSATGPTVSTNPNGTGDKINGNVNYSPYATSSACNSFAIAVAPPVPDTLGVDFNVSTSFALGSFVDTLAGESPWNVDVSWGDSSSDTMFSTPSQGSLGNQNHTYTTAGTYTVTVTVSNHSNNNAGTATFQVQVAGLPTATISGPSDGVANQSRIFTFTASDTSLDNAAGYTYSINWGDGNMQTVGPTANNTPQSVAHPYANTGTYAVSVTATDQYGNTSAPVSQLITIGLVALEPNMPAQGDINGLAIAGTSDSRGVVLTPGAAVNSITVTRMGANLGTFTVASGSVAVYGDGGSDNVTVNGTNPPALGSDTYTIGGNVVQFQNAALDAFNITLNTINLVTLEGGGHGNSFIDNVASVAAKFAGGAGNDTYAFTGSSMGANTTITDPGGNNTLTGPTLSPTAPNVWIVNGRNSGTLNTVCTFTGIQNLTGGSNSDQFLFYGTGSVAGAVNGVSGGTLDYTHYTGPSVAVNLQTLKATGTGSFSNMQTFIGHTPSSSTLTAANAANTWNITGANSGTLNAYNFSYFGNLTGGTSTDSFIVGTSGSLAGTMNGGGGNDTLTGPNLVSTFNITASNAGNLDGTVIPTFKAISNLIGGSQANSFVFSRSVGITGNLNGGGGGTLDYSAYTSAVLVNFTNNKVSGVGGTATNLVDVIGGSSTGNTLTGANVANIWNITGINAGTLNGTFAFSNFGNLTGASTHNDDFVFSTGSSQVMGTVKGLGGTNTLDYSSYGATVYVNLLTGAATGTHTVSGIQDVYGSGQNDVLVGNGNGVLLVETTGNNLLIGGTGQATIDSGSGEDIVIAGSTTYANNQTALLAIEAYWENPSNGTETARVSTLSTTGVSGYKLNTSTVTHPHFSDTLDLGSTTDWVFYHAINPYMDHFIGSNTPAFTTFI